MKDRKYNVVIEDLWVEITYEYEKGDNGDEFTPPTSPFVTIIEWKLTNGDCREEYLDYTNEEWDKWMRDIDYYVHNFSFWDIIEFEKDLEQWEL